MHVHGDGHRTEPTEAPASDEASRVTSNAPTDDTSDEDGFFTWPDDGPDALPASAFQVVSEDELPPDAWPHPSTWAIPGTDWNELHEPSEAEEV
jgi:hypothetical protein